MRIQLVGLNSLLVWYITIYYENTLGWLSLLGDLRLVDKPVPTTMGPHGFENIKATIKISSTENGIIFGNM